MAPPLQPEPLILASQSPRRRQLLLEAGYRFEVVEPKLGEPDWVHPHLGPAMHVESLAYFKARSVAADHLDQTILAADTIAVVDGRIIGKPRDLDDARNILNALSGKAHSVITGVVLLHAASGRRMLQHNITTVRFRALTQEMVEAYLRTRRWAGKAGAYGAQDQDDPFVLSITGSFTNVVGLPMELLTQMFGHWLGTG